METTVTLTLNLQPEIALQVLNLISGKTDCVPTPAPTPTPVQNALPKNTAPVFQQSAPQTPVTPPPVQTPVQTAPVAPPPAYDAEMLGRAAAPLMAQGRQQELIGLLQSFGVQALTQLPPNRYGEFATALRGLGAQI